MSASTLSLRQLFQVDPRDLSAQIDPDIAAKQTVDKIRQQVSEGSHFIRWTWVAGLVRDEGAHILDLDVVELLVDAWKKYEEVEECADQKNGEAALVSLVERTLKSEHHPGIEVLVNNHPAGQITFDLDLSLTLQGFVLRIENGRILEVQTGSATGELCLSLAGKQILKRESRSLSFPGKIGLGEGIPLRTTFAPAA